MVLCDTNILIEFYKDNPHIVQELRLIGQDQLVISPITRAELYFGALNKVELEKLKKHLSSLHQLPLDVAISNMFLRLMETYSLSHKLNIVPKSIDIYGHGANSGPRFSGQKLDR